MKLIEKMKVFEEQYLFLRWATGAEYGKVITVGEDFIEFNILDVDTMEYRETVIINSQLVLEIVFGGSDISRLIAEISSLLPDANSLNQFASGILLSLPNFSCLCSDCLCSFVDRRMYKYFIFYSS